MPETNSILRLRQLRLRNFRCFSECKVDFHEKLTVLVAENGHGKTAVLDAIRKALFVFTSAVGRGKLPPSLEAADIRLEHAQPILPTRFELDLFLMGEPETFGREVRTFRRRPRNTKSELKHFQVRCAELHAVAFGPSPSVLPVVAYYGTGRLFDQHRLTESKRWMATQNPYRVGAYWDSLSPSASYKAFVVWYENQMDFLANPTSKTATIEGRPEQLLAAIEKAVKKVLEPSGWSNLNWEAAKTIGDGRKAIYIPGQIKLQHEEHGRLPLDFLSDGIQSMVALVADLAHKCARLNPYLGLDAAQKTPGIVLIDEVDMHLHPQWQQVVIGLLQEAFPLVQFIVTTHSPHVLTSVDAQSIRLLSTRQAIGSAEPPKVQTKGDESGNVLARAMHVNPVPDVGPARQLSAYIGLIQNGQDDTGLAREMWSDLVSHFGEGHHLLQEAAALRRFQEFKRDFQRNK